MMNALSFNRDIVECKERVTGQKTEVGILF